MLSAIKSWEASNPLLGRICSRKWLPIKKLKLKKQLLLLLAIAIVMMTMVQMFYYYRFGELTEERARGYADKFISQVRDSLEDITSRIEGDAETIAYNRFVQQFIVSEDGFFRTDELSPYVFDLFSYILSSNPYLYDICLYDDLNRFTSGAMNLRYDILKQTEEAYPFRETDFHSQIFTQAFYSGSDNIYYFAHIVPVYSNRPQYRMFEKVGVAVFLSSTNIFQPLVENAALTENALFMILDSQNRVMAANSTAMYGQIWEEDTHLQGWSDSDGDILYEDVPSIVQVNVLNKTGWKIVSIIPVSELSDDMKPIRAFGLMFGLIMTGILTALSVTLIQGITRPIYAISLFMNEIMGTYSLKKRIAVTSENEIGQLAHNINKILDSNEQMTRKIFETQQSLYETEIAKKQAELSSLQSQINPHFLYNTLNCISSIARINGIEEIELISTAMSKIFRYCVKEKEYVKISSELECIKDYLSIMNIRYPNKFEARIHIEDKILDLPMLKMVIQPIVENAIYHGLEQKRTNGLLKIRGWENEEESLEFEVEDNGLGIPEGELKELVGSMEEDSLVPERNKRSIGLYNINRRIRLAYGPRFGLVIESREGKGTKVTVRMPKTQLAFDPFRCEGA